MSEQLKAFVNAGGKIIVDGRTYSFDTAESPGDAYVVTLTASRAKFRATRNANACTMGNPNAQIWRIERWRSRERVGDFILDNGRIYDPRPQLRQGSASDEMKVTQ